MSDSQLNIVKAKLVMVGDTSVGKSSICIRFAKGSFTEFQESTIGAAFFTQSIQTNSGRVQFDVWDTAGQERYHALMPMYYHGAQAAVVVYDMTRMSTFDRAKAWIKELKKGTSENCVIALVGNKIDKLDDKEVDESIAKSFADKNGLLFIETSAKTNVNIRQLFVMISNILVKIPQKKKNDDEIIFDDDDPFNQNQPNKKCCVIL